MKKKTMDAILIKVGRPGALNKLGHSYLNQKEAGNKFVGVLAQNIRADRHHGTGYSAHLQSISNQEKKEITFISPVKADVGKLKAVLSTLGFKAHEFVGEF